MPTPREVVLSALHARLSALPATTLRGDVLPERVPAEGLLILRDGEPGEPEVTLSPPAYHYQHRHCQSNLNPAQKSHICSSSGGQLSPFSKRSVAVLPEVRSAGEMAIEIEVVEDGSVNGDKFLKRGIALH